MNKLTETDLNFVLGRCPVDIRKVLKANAGNLFLAGGFIRSTIAGEKVSDVDLFGLSKELLLTIAKDFTLERRGRLTQTDNAITVLAPPRYPIQFITRWIYDNPTKLIETFDFTVCQAVIWAEKIKAVWPGKTEPEERCIFHSKISDNFYSDLAARRLVYTSPQREEEAGGSLMRAFKFVKKGWNIQAPSIASVVSRLVEKVSDEEKALNGFVGTHEQKIAKILTGLLRQVDPLTVIDGIDLIDEHEVIQP